jgi:hypothetical protein
MRLLQEAKVQLKHREELRLGEHYYILKLQSSSTTAIRFVLPNGQCSTTDRFALYPQAATY